MPTEYKRKSNNKELWTNEGLLDAVKASSKWENGCESKNFDFYIEEMNEK